jgi:hypothetical protein
MDDDNGLRDAVRGFILHVWGETINDIGKKVEATGARQVGGCTVHSKEELIEGMVNEMFQEHGIAGAFKKFYEEHGFYPPLPDLSKLPTLQGWCENPKDSP